MFHQPNRPLPSLPSLLSSPNWLFFLFWPFFSFAQSNPHASPKPRLIVGIVVDQMRYDYLTRYWDGFGDDGFRKLVNQGFNCTNTHYNYIPTYTAPGHASIYTGTTPALHGIISNDWFDRNADTVIYVTSDAAMQTVGSTSMAGRMSPKNLLTTTISDELRLATNMQAKVVGIALKDRSAILPAGHSANAAFWFDPVSGNWITSTYYMQQLPGWVDAFNKKALPQSLMSEPWTLLRNPSAYTQSTTDNTLYEDTLYGETKPVFPHTLKSVPGRPFDQLRYTPYGNTITLQFALAALVGEQLGKDAVTDILAVSFSSPDYVGHQYGTHSIEMQDCYMRLDRDIAELIRQAEEIAGKGNVLFFLTADHAAIPNPLFLKDRKIPAGLFNITALTDTLKKFIVKTYNQPNWFLAMENDQVYLALDSIIQSKNDPDSVSKTIAKFLSSQPGIITALTAEELKTNEYSWGPRSFLQKGFYPKRSGDVAFILEPGLIEYKIKGTTHGSGYTYDTHVPLLFYGTGIRTGRSVSHVDITDIAPTLSQMLGIQPPNGCTGKVISELFK